MTTATILFYAFALLAVVGALGMVLNFRNTVAAAMSLVMTMVALAGIYVLMGAHLVAAFQIMVYGGAIVVLFLFVVMLLSGLSSTLDSGLSAASSLWVTDIAKPKNDKEAINAARFAMISITAAGLLVALAVITIPGFGLQHLWWIFNTIAACVMVPTVLSLYWNQLSERGVFWGVLIAFVVGIPLFIRSSGPLSPFWSLCINATSC